MIENIIIGIIFVGAIAYLGNMLKRQFTASKTGCASNCGKCNVSFNNINALPKDEI